MLVNLIEILKLAEEKKYAVGAFNIPNLECVNAVIDAAEKLMRKDPLNMVFLKLFGKAAVQAGYPDLAVQTLAMVREAGYPALRSRALLSNAGSRNVLAKVGFSEIGEDTAKAGTLAGQRVMQMRLEFAA